MARVKGERMSASVTVLERITCDNPDCIVYVEELVREQPGRYELGVYTRSLLPEGWTHHGVRDFCPAHVGLVT
jgi:hypothetical protein